MLKSHKARSTLATALLAGTACGSGGCASAPQPVADPPPPLIPCPPGARETQERYAPDNNLFLLVVPALIDFTPGEGAAAAFDGGTIRAKITKSWGEFKEGTPLIGRTWFGRDRVYGRMTEIILPSGEHLPVCFDLNLNGLGQPMKPGSTRSKALIHWATRLTIAPELLP